MLYLNCIHISSYLFLGAEFVYHWNLYFIRFLSLERKNIRQSDVKTWHTWEALVLKTPCFTFLIGSSRNLPVSAKFCKKEKADCRTKYWMDVLVSLANLIPVFIMELMKIKSHVYFGSEAVYFKCDFLYIYKQLFLTGILIH